ncbi:MAG: PaaI family thioesterase [Myxococcota bacterium]|nr:PaaI family thioesterase [Myxococcota bacterium]MEC8380331.1 PaaI family thioesterase [Myxococcota bacterium]
MSSEHFECLERMYLKAPINVFYQPKIQIEDDKTQISITLTQQMHHSARGVHGSVYFKLLDDAAFFAANAIETEVFVLTSDFHIRLLRPISEGIITAVGWVTHAGRRNILASAELHDSEGQLIATGQGSFTRSRIQLSPECGYE